MVVTISKRALCPSSPLAVLCTGQKSPTRAGKDFAKRFFPPHP
ncbi:MAG: hypothetical protein AAF443_07660 [Chlamydiota bacterium]